MEAGLWNARDDFHGGSRPRRHHPSTLPEDAHHDDHHRRRDHAIAQSQQLHADALRLLQTSSLSSPSAQSLWNMTLRSSSSWPLHPAGHVDSQRHKRRGDAPGHGGEDRRARERLNSSLSESDAIDATSPPPVAPPRKPPNGFRDATVVVRLDGQRPSVSDTSLFRRESPTIGSKARDATPQPVSSSDEAGHHERDAHMIPRRTRSMPRNHVSELVNSASDNDDDYSASHPPVTRAVLLPRPAEYDGWVYDGGVVTRSQRVLGPTRTIVESVASPAAPHRWGLQGDDDDPSSPGTAAAPTKGGGGPTTASPLAAMAAVSRARALLQTVVGGVPPVEVGSWTMAPNDASWQTSSVPLSHKQHNSAKGGGDAPGGGVVVRRVDPERTGRSSWVLPRPSDDVPAEMVYASASSLVTATSSRVSDVLRRTQQPGATPSNGTDTIAPRRSEAFHSLCTLFRSGAQLSRDASRACGLLADNDDGVGRAGRTHRSTSPVGKPLLSSTSLFLRVSGDNSEWDDGRLAGDDQADDSPERTAWPTALPIRLDDHRRLPFARDASPKMRSAAAVRGVDDDAVGVVDISAGAMSHQLSPRIHHRRNYNDVTDGHRREEDETRRMPRGMSHFDEMDGTASPSWREQRHHLVMSHAAALLDRLRQDKRSEDVGKGDAAHGSSGSGGYRYVHRPRYVELASLTPDAEIVDLPDDRHGAAPRRRSRTDHVDSTNRPSSSVAHVSGEDDATTRRSSAVLIAQEPISSRPSGAKGSSRGDDPPSSSVTVIGSHEDSALARRRRERQSAAATACEATSFTEPAVASVARQPAAALPPSASTPTNSKRVVFVDGAAVGSTAAGDAAPLIASGHHSEAPPRALVQPNANVAAMTTAGAQRHRDNSGSTGPSLEASSPSSSSPSRRCVWCKKPASKAHDLQCPDRRVVCKKCFSEVLVSGKNQHRAVCPGSAGNVVRERQTATNIASNR